MKDRLRIRKEEEVSSRGRGKPRYAAVRTLNLENGMPTVEEALNQLRAELQRLKREGAKAVKLIHGYGSTGTGGKICIGVRRELAQMQRRQAISLFVAGEDFGPFHEDARKMADRIREITRDPDYGKCNHGITMVLL